MNTSTSLPPGTVVPDTKIGVSLPMPTVEEVAQSLMGEFPDDQAYVIAAAVYHPIREMFERIALSSVR